MSGTIKFRDLKMECGQLIITPVKEDIGPAMALVRRHKNRLYDLEVKEHREKRSLDANAYAWKLMGELSAATHVPVMSIYREYIRDMGGNFEIVPVREDRINRWERIWCSGHDGRQCVDMGPCRNLPGYHNIRSYIGSSDYDSRQMSRLLEYIIEDCKQCGIEYLTEREQSLLVDEWKENYG